MVKSFKLGKRVRKIKPGVSFSVLTSNNGIDTNTMVSKMHSFHSFLF